MGISKPQQNEIILSGTAVLVQGGNSDGDPDTRRPPTVESVIAQVDGGASNDLHFIQHHTGFITHVSYQGDVGILADGSHTIEVTSAFSTGDANMDSVSFMVALQTPLESQFIGTATLKTSYSHAPGPYSSQVTIGVLFSPDRKTVTITDFPPLTTLPIPLPWPLGSDTVTVSLTGGGTGGFDPPSGAMSIPATLHFHHSNSLLSDSDLSLILSTGSERSPNGVFNDQGSPMLNGNITLVGDGAFNGGVLGGYDASLVIAGAISPLP